MKQFFTSIFFFIFSLTLVGGVFLSAKAFPKQKGKQLLAQTTERSFRARTKAQGIKVKLSISDNTQQDYFDVEEVEFNNKKIFLKNADVKGHRGDSFFHLKPGKYQLKWKISYQKSDWPRNKTFTKTIQINEGDKWVEIIIEGENAYVENS